MKLAFIGIGNVGYALANNLQHKGHEIIIAHNDVKSDSVVNARQKNTQFTALPIQEAINESDLIFLATPFNVNETILKPLHFEAKTLVDCTNPVGAGITHGLGSKIQVQKKFRNGLILPKWLNLTPFMDLKIWQIPIFQITT